MQRGIVAAVTVTSVIALAFGASLLPTRAGTEIEVSSPAATPTSSLPTASIPTIGEISGWPLSKVTIDSGVHIERLEPIVVQSGESAEFTLRVDPIGQAYDDGYVLLTDFSGRALGGSTATARLTTSLPPKHVGDDHLVDAFVTAVRWLEKPLVPQEVLEPGNYLAWLVLATDSQPDEHDKRVAGPVPIEVVP